MDKEKNGNFYDFCKIIEKLRAPDGCPWDREQTHESLSKHLLEEAYEAYDAIKDKDPKKIADELGDVLLQVVMHAQIGKEEGEFTIDDVVSAVSEKMIRRHPHVFGNENVKNSAEVLKNWEEIKKTHRKQKYAYEAMEGITPSLPSLTRCEKVIAKAEKAGFVEKNDGEIKTSSDEIGEKLFEICLISHKNGIDAEEALSSFTKKFIKKIKNIEENS